MLVLTRHRNAQIINAPVSPICIIVERNSQINEFNLDLSPRFSNLN